MPDALPPVWVKVAVEPQLESSEETWKSEDGAVAVMLAVRFTPVTETEVEVEGAPTTVESAEADPVTVIVGDDGAGVERLALLPKAVSVLDPLRALTRHV